MIHIQTAAEALGAFHAVTGLPMPEDPRQAVLRLRAAISDELEHMLGLLDALDGDPDLEPSYCGTTVDRPAPGREDAEADNDDELSLGWSNTFSQALLGAGADDGDESALERHGYGFVRSGRDDAEEDDDGGGDINDLLHDGETDSEPTLGWTIGEADFGIYSSGPDECEAINEDGPEPGVGE